MNKTILKNILKDATIEYNQTYEQALDDCFKYYLQEEFEESDDLTLVREEFEKSSYYFLEVKDFAKQKLNNIESFLSEANKILIKSIDTLAIEDLRELKTIYNKIEKLCDSAFCDLDFLNNNNH